MYKKTSHDVDAKVKIEFGARNGRLDPAIHLTITFYTVVFIIVFATMCEWCKGIFIPCFDCALVFGLMVTLSFFVET